MLLPTAVVAVTVAVVVAAVAIVVAAVAVLVVVGFVIAFALTVAITVVGVVVLFRDAGAGDVGVGFCLGVGVVRLGVGVAFCVRPECHAAL